MARRVYVRLARYPDLSKAMRGAREFYDDNRRFIDSDIILRLDAMRWGRRVIILTWGQWCRASMAKIIVNYLPVVVYV